MAGRLGAFGGKALLDYERLHGQSRVTGEDVIELSNEELGFVWVGRAESFADLFAATIARVILQGMSSSRAHLLSGMVSK